MKMSWCLMDEVFMVLTCMASLSIGDGIRDHLQSIIAKSSEPVSKFGSGLMSSAHTIMSFFEASSASLCERHQSRIPSYDQRYNVHMIIL